MPTVCPLFAYPQKALGGAVKPSDSLWTLEDGTLHIQLAKAEEGATWASAIAGWCALWWLQCFVMPAKSDLARFFGFCIAHTIIPCAPCFGQFSWRSRWCVYGRPRAAGGRATGRSEAASAGALSGRGGNAALFAIISCDVCPFPFMAACFHEC